MKAIDKSPANPENESSYDSDDYPKYYSGEVSNSPDHCEGGRNCLERIYLHIKESELVGSETSRIGALLCDSLTPDGVEHLKQMLGEPNPTVYQRALHDFWRETFNIPA